MVDPPENVAVRALFLPTDYDNIDKVKCRLIEKGHEGVYTGEDKQAFFREFNHCSVVLAIGNLTPLGIWLWGYVYARRKKVRAIKGVNPCPVTKTVDLDKWLESLPEQLSLFSHTDYS